MADGFASRESIRDDGLGAARDRGFTFIELLVAVVLLGTIVVATLAGLRAAIVAGTVDENHSKTYAWLQTASDAIATTVLSSRPRSSRPFRNRPSRRSTQLIDWS